METNTTLTLTRNKRDSLTNKKNGMTMRKLQSTSDEKDWKKVLINIIVKIFTLGFYHIEKHRKKD